MFIADEVIEILDDTSGDIYFYEVEVDTEGLQSIINLRKMIEESLNEGLHG